MHGPVRFQDAIPEENGRVFEEGARETVHSADAVIWDIGLVLAVFLGLALTINATLMAFGVN